MSLCNILFCPGAWQHDLLADERVNRSSERDQVEEWKWNTDEVEI